MLGLLTRSSPSPALTRLPSLSLTAISPPHIFPINPSSGRKSSADAPATQLASSVMPYMLTTLLVPDQSMISRHSLDGSGAEPMETWRNLGLVGGLAAFKTRLHIAGTELMNVIWCDSMIVGNSAALLNPEKGANTRLFPVKRGVRQFPISPWPKWVGKVHRVVRRTSSPMYC